MGLVQEMPRQERPLSEQYRLTANAWVDADAAARLLEELKTTKLEQEKTKLFERHGEMPDNRAERIVKASPAWELFIKQMVEAKTEANRLKAQLAVISMRERELADRNATIRAEQRLSGR